MTNHAGSSVDIEQLYSRLAPLLRRILTANLQAPEWVLEEACQTAWTALMANPDPLEEAHVLGWLATTARREALVTLKRADFELRLVGSERAGVGADAEDPARAAEFWERLGQVRRLSRRQQRIVWMQGMGFRYEEIAEETGESVRSVHRQLAAARRQLGSAA